MLSAGVNRILWVDLSSGEVTTVEADEATVASFIGGRGFGVKTLFDSCPSRTQALSPDNVLIFAVGPLVGTLAPSSGRVEVIAKSPLTGLLGRSNAGGDWGPELRYCGFLAIVITGKARSTCYLSITNSACDINSASHVWGHDTLETDAIIRKETHLEAKVAAIGVGGERLVKYACIMFSVHRAAGRTGMGAVMGSKNLKAIALKGSEPVIVHDCKGLEELSSELRERLKQDPLLEKLGKFGSAGLISKANSKGKLPTRNWRQGHFDSVDDITGETLERTYLRRMKSCFSCPLHCRPYHYVDHGVYKGSFGSGPEYETLAAFGSRLCISDLASICFAHTLCNRYGLDVISTAQAIASTIEWHEEGIISKRQLEGLNLRWGDPEGALELIRRIALREGFGDLLAEGSREVARSLGPDAYAATIEVKGLELPGIDPRGGKAWGLAFAVATRGADHLTSFNVIESTGSAAEGRCRFGTEKAVDPLSHDGKAAMVVWHEHVSALCDSLTVCKYPTLQVQSLYNAITPADMAALYETVTGVRVSQSKLLEIGERILNLERLFNRREGGGGREDDTLPERIMNTKSVSIPDLDRSEIDLERLKDEYYSLRGWDVNSGLPKAGKLKALGLLDESSMST